VVDQAAADAAEAAALARGALRWAGSAAGREMVAQLLVRIASTFGPAVRLDVPTDGRVQWGEVDVSGDEWIARVRARDLLRLLRERSAWANADELRAAIAERWAVRERS